MNLDKKWFVAALGITLLGTVGAEDSGTSVKKSEDTNQTQKDSRTTWDFIIPIANYGQSNKLGNG